MKNAINFVKRNVIRNISLALIFSIFAAAPAIAGDKVKEAAAEIRYLGNYNGNTVFQINYDNADGEEFTITLKDEYGNILFFDASKEKKYGKKVQFEGVQLEELKLTMTVRSKKSAQSQNFRISKTTRTVEEVAVVTL